MSTQAGRDRFLAQTNVSRETMRRLESFAALLEKWTTAINLISRDSLRDLWRRHFLDSAQLFGVARITSGHWVDLGSGGGFPGMVCAIMAQESAPALRFTLVESDSRKATFLRTVQRETGVKVDVVNDRIENVPPLGADILSARALAPLKILLAYADRHLTADGKAIFLKGQSFQAELEEALESWTFRREEYPSRTDGAGIVLSLGDIRRV